MTSFRRDVPRELYRSYNDSKHVVTWRNGSTTRFGYSQSENDVYQYQGAEFLFIGIDELTLFTLNQWQFLTSRNRCPVPGTFPNMAGATRSEEHTSELQSRLHLVCRLLLEKKNRPGGRRGRGQLRARRPRRLRRPSS